MEQVVEDFIQKLGDEVVIKFDPETMVGKLTCFKDGEASGRTAITIEDSLVTQSITKDKHRGKYIGRFKGKFVILLDDWDLTYELKREA